MLEDYNATSEFDCNPMEFDAKASVATISLYATSFSGAPDKGVVISGFSLAETSGKKNLTVNESAELKVAPVVRTARSSRSSCYQPISETAPVVTASFQ